MQSLTPTSEEEKKANQVAAAPPTPLPWWRMAIAWVALVAAVFLLAYAVMYLWRTVRRPQPASGGAWGRGKGKGGMAGGCACGGFP